MSEGRERSFVIGIFGDNYEYRKLLGQALGSPGTQSDIQFFNRLDDQLGYVLSSLTPIDYPEKIKPFLQTCIITNIHILVIDLETGLNSVIGEILVGMDIIHQIFETRILCVITNITSKSEWKLQEIKKKLVSIIDTTSLKGCEIYEIKEKSDYEVIKRKVVQLGETLSEPKLEIPLHTKVLIDHCFPVKGIGTVILGIVKKGVVNVSQMLKIVGYEGDSKKVIVRSIQKHDREFKSAHEGDRVGLALKGNISPEQISRDNILVSIDGYKQEKEIKAKVFVNPFYKPKDGSLKSNSDMQFHAIVELKSSPLKFGDGDDLTPGKKGIIQIKFDKYLVHDGSGLKGIITELNKFHNKLRIVGYFEQILI
jgi:selenocysteine-specific translation elongation factor